MNIVLYSTLDDRRKVDKSLSQLTSYSNAIIKDSPNSLTDPIIRVNTFSQWNSCNYAYIEEYGRYYHVNDIREIHGGMLELICHVDVLKSNKTDIMNLSAIVERGSNSNPYLVDNEQEILNYRSQHIINFPTANSFSDSFDYVLTVAGGEGSI